MKREYINKIRYILEEILPPIFRDSFVFKYLFRQYMKNKDQEKLKSNIIVKKSNDPRSYRLSSEKLLRTGFKPKKTVEMAINELILLYENNLETFDDSNFNVKWLKNNNFK